jgi:hypothetical protein
MPQTACPTAGGGHPPLQSVTAAATSTPMASIRDEGLGVWSWMKVAVLRVGLKLDGWGEMGVAVREWLTAAGGQGVTDEPVAPSITEEIGAFLTCSNCWPSLRS